MAKIYASWINGVIDRYNTQLGLSLAHATVGQRITAAFFNNIINEVSVACAAQGKTCALPPLQSVGGKIGLLQFPDVVTPVVAGTASWTSNASWTVPQNVTSIMVNWIVGGGGAGGVGTEYGYGGGGGGGGSGGYKQYYQLAVNPGDILTITIGAGGTPASSIAQNVGINGGDGGDTSIKIKATTLLLASGGKGGAGSINYNQGALVAVGGLGGSFNGVSSGLAGQNGQVGGNDHASTYGGGGAPGPIQGAFGGSGGKAGGGASPTGASRGQNGIGYGSGGGGGGSSDRSGAHFWAGGNGVGGYVEIAWPAAGASGGTPAANNSGYSASALTSGSTGGGYTGGSGYGGGNASGLFTS